MFTLASRHTVTALRAAAGLVLALAATTSSACYTPPRDQLIGVDEQIYGASDITVAQVIAATPLGGNSVEYHFTVLQRLAGADQTSFEMTGFVPRSNAIDTSFDRHRAPAFWAHGGGRSMNDMDCVIHPTFVVGATYLVFRAMAPTWRSFEKIEAANGVVDEGDRWLAYVKAKLGMPSVPSMSRPGGAATPDYARIGKFIDDGASFYER